MSQSKMPEHIAIIMDGNGRWAKRRLLSTSVGHRAGATALRSLCKAMNRANFKYLTVYAFSTENWKRSDNEVSYLMGLIDEYIQKYIDDAKNDTMRLQTIGDLSALNPELQEKIAKMKEITKNKTGLTLTIAINYGGRDEIIRAIKSIKNSDIDAKNINENLFSSYLDTSQLPKLDLIIRTGGEMRLSNFLIWQSAYAEFYATKTLWPDFGIKDLNKALESYNKRERRFGGR